MNLDKHLQNNDEAGDLREKILKLFHYRQIPWLLSLTDFEDTSKFNEQLVELQAAIYHLDSYLELNWDIDPNRHSQFWIEIRRHLAALGLSKYQQESWASEIKIYEARELALREQISPLQHDIESLYYYKSCDVRLIRRFIYRSDPALRKLVPFSDWAEFDLLTEVNDDIEDLWEDLDILNGNRFLFSLYEKGLNKTHKMFCDFIDLKISSSITRFSKAKLLRAELGKKVHRIGLETKELLNLRIDKLDLKLLEESRLLEAYNSSVSEE